MPIKQLICKNGIWFLNHQILYDYNDDWKDVMDRIMSLQNSHVEALISKVTIFGDRAVKKIIKVK